MGATQYFVGLQNYRACIHWPNPLFPYLRDRGSHPNEIGLPSPRTQNYDPVTNGDVLAVDMDLLEKGRLQAAIKVASYQ